MEYNVKEDLLREMCQMVIGKNVNDPAANDLLDAADWAGYYPVADEVDGKFTGEVVETQNLDYHNISDLYAVRRWGG